MRGTNVNKFGKKEKNQKVKEGECIFPFKFQWKDNNECLETDKGNICATSVTDRGTLKTYGYCETSSRSRSKSKSKSKVSLKKVTKKRALKMSKKLKLVDKFPSRSKSISKSKSKSKSKTVSKSKSKSKSPINLVSKSKSKSKSRSKSPIKIEETIDMDIKPSPKGKSMNKELIDIMEELADIMMRQGEPFKSRAYKKASETIMGYSGEITNVSELKGKPAIGKTIMEKLEEFQKTGTLRVLERERKNPMNLFTQIYGIGPKKAKQLIEGGITTIAELRENENKLNDTQKIGLKYFEPLQKRIPRDEIEEFNKEFDKIFKEVAPEGSKYQIVGSYRRGAKTSGDIDVIITNDQNNVSVFNDFLDKLIKEKVVTEVLTRGKTKSLTIGEIPGSIPRRLDFLYTAPKEYSFATLYFTGSKAFNIVMRQRALDVGLTLNEHGLFKMTAGKKGEAVDIDFPTEESIFEFLGMKYKEPKQREGYKSVELLETKEGEKIEEEKNDKS